MKEVHMICNAHLDPIWQWEWEEGAAAALSTFRAAADLAEEFDYIFCHNEVTLYKYIEEYAPDLFARIKKLIREGRWHIMGGWYLQPDCNMPSGESFIRHILVGRRYFMEKFGAAPTTAINFDAFGHTRGLVQIMTKCGQDSLFLCRPGNDPIPSNQFLWEGFDGSKVKVCATVGYNSPLGGAAGAIMAKVNTQPQDVVCALWGVGNHGGGPSRKDLADIKDLIEKGDMELIHSTPENFFARINPELVHAKSLRTVMPGCYTTMSRIKQKHAELENTLWMTEKLCSLAALKGLIEYPEAELDTACEDLLNAQFHDVLPGSSVRAGEENGLMLLDHGLLTLNRLRARAYFALSYEHEKAKDSEYPILVFNPNPYVWDTEITCELMLADQNWSGEVHYEPHVYGADGQEIAAQVVKEESNIALDWRKRIVFKAPLKPLGLTRFSIYMELVQNTPKEALSVDGDIVIDLPEIEKRVVIDGRTGLLSSYMLGGREYIGEGGAFLPMFFEDNPDPWGMSGVQLAGMGRNPVPFELMKNPDGPFVGMKPIQIREDGDILTSVECFFERENTKVRVQYDIYKKSPAVDVTVDAFMNDANRMLKLRVPVTGGTYFGQTAFGAEELYMDGRECVAQRYVSVRPENSAEKCLALINRGTYGSSFRDGGIEMSLLRGTAYCAHPIGDRPIVPADKFVKHVDLGERNFSFRLIAADENTLERLAAEFNVLPYACNVFPLTESGANAECAPVITVSDPDVTLVTAKKEHGGSDYILRLYSGCSGERKCRVAVLDAETELCFKQYEVKTLRYSGGTIAELENIII